MNPVTEVLKIVVRIAEREGWLNDEGSDAVEVDPDDPSQDLRQAVTSGDDVVPAPMKALS